MANPFSDCARKDLVEALKKDWEDAKKIAPELGGKIEAKTKEVAGPFVDGAVEALKLWSDPAQAAKDKLTEAAEAGANKILKDSKIIDEDLQEVGRAKTK